MFRDGNWKLVRDWSIVSNDDGSWKAPTISWVGMSHQCYGEAWSHKVNRLHLDKGLCGHCGEKIPQEIIGLQQLANWDR